jgi:hypothetical protein
MELDPPPRKNPNLQEGGEGRGCFVEVTPLRKDVERRLVIRRK